MHRILKLIDQYWDIAYQEGLDNRDHDTEDGIADKTRRKIEAELKEIHTIAYDLTINRRNWCQSFCCGFGDKCDKENCNIYTTLKKWEDYTGRK